MPLFLKIVNKLFLTNKKLLFLLFLSLDWCKFNYLSKALMSFIHFILENLQSNCVVLIPVKGVNDFVEYKAYKNKLEIISAEISNN